jgi:hypothetical protein
MPLLERIVGSLFFFVGLPAVVFFFVRLILRDKTEVERLKAKKELLEAEAKMQDAKARTLAEENRKYDRIIAESEKGRTTGESGAEGSP